MSGYSQLLRKDIQCFWRAKGVAASSFGFALLFVVTASFAFRQIGYGEKELKELTPGVLWLVFLFSSVIGLNHAFISERENGAVFGVLLAPVDPGQVFLSKFSSNLLFLGLLQIFVLVVHGVLFGADLFSSFFALLGISLLSAIGIAALGTLLSAMAVYTRGREILLPLMLFPLLLPLTAGAVFLMRIQLLEGSFEFSNFWFLLLVGFDAAALMLSWALFEFVLRE